MCNYWFAGRLMKFDGCKVAIPGGKTQVMEVVGRLKELGYSPNLGNYSIITSIYIYSGTSVFMMSGTTGFYFNNHRNREISIHQILGNITLKDIYNS